jgi:tape measure domain-containing protein
MANAGELKLKLTLLADGLKQALGNAKQDVDNFKRAASGDAKADFTDALKNKIAQADAELKKAKEDLDKLKAALNGKSGPLADSINQEIGKAEARIRATTAELDKLKTKLNTASSNALANNANASLNQVGNTATGLRGKLESTFSNIGGMIAGAFAVGAVVAWSKSLLDTVQKVQDLRIRISGLTLSAQDYAASEAYLVDLAARHHKSVDQLSDSYAAFLTLERSGIITRQQSIQLTEGFSNVASKTGANTVQMGQSVYGLSQLLSAGAVKMQDFRQVTDPMPGLMNKIADAFGMTVGQLRELVASGSLSSEEFGQKFVVALKNYEGAAARSAGTISATYADVENAKIEMAKELEKPIANTFLSLMDGVKEAYKVLSDNSGVIVAGVTAVGVVMASKAAGGIATYTQSIYANIKAEQTAQAELVKTAQARLATKQTNVVLAQAKVEDTALTLNQIKAEVALVNTEKAAAINKAINTNAIIASTRARIAELSAMAQTPATQAALTAATQKLATVEAEQRITLTNLTALRARAVTVTASLTAATAAQTSATKYLAGSQAAAATAQTTLNTTVAQSSVLMARLGSAAKSAMAFLGGPVGVAVIALYALYEVLNKVFDAEGKAEEAARKHSEALDKINESVKKLNQEEVKLETAKAQKEVEDLKKKIDEVEKFKPENLKDVGITLATMFTQPRVAVTKFNELLQKAGIRQVLKDDLNLVEEKLKALNAQDLELIKNFDATKLDKGQLQDALKETQANLKKLSDEAGALDKKLHEQGGLSFYEQKQLNDDNLRISAFEAKESAIQKQIELTSGATQEAITKKKKAAAKEATKTIIDELKEITKEEDSEMARRMELIRNNLSQRQAAIELSKGSEADKEKQITAAVKAAGDAQLLIIKANGQEKLRITDETFNAEMAKHKEGSFMYKSLEAEKLQHELGVYRDMEKSYSDTVTQQIAEEKRLVQEAKRLANERKGIEQSYEDFKRQLHQVGLTDDQKKQEDITQLRKLASDRQKAIKQGDYQQAEAIDRQILESGKSLALAESQKAAEAKKTGKAYSDSTSEIVSMTDAAQKRIVAANQAAQDANKQRLDDTKVNAETAKEQLAGIQAEIANLTKELTAKGFMLTMNADTKAVDAAIARISKPTESTHTIHVKQDGSSGGNIKGYARGGLLDGEGSNTGDANLAYFSPEEFLVKASSVKGVGVHNLNYINENGKLPPAPKFAGGGLISGLKPSYQSSFTPSQAQPQSGETFTLYLAMPNGAVGILQGNKQGNNGFLDEVAYAMTQQARSMG